MFRWTETCSVNDKYWRVVFDCNTSLVFNTVFRFQEALEMSPRACNRRHMCQPKFIIYETLGLPAGCSTLLAQAHGDIWLTLYNTESASQLLGYACIFNLFSSLKPFVFSEYNIYHEESVCFFYFLAIQLQYKSKDYFLGPHANYSYQQEIYSHFLPYTSRFKNLETNFLISPPPPNKC